MLAESFILPDAKLYMCGHSLGPCLLSTQYMMDKTMQDFALYGVRNWNDQQWIDLPFVLGEKIAKLIGALDTEVVVTDSTVVNLFKVLKAALQLQGDRQLILTTDDIFPADLYIAQGVGMVKRVKPEALIDNINEEVAVLMLSHVNYRDASLLDMQRINAVAAKHGVLSVWDLSHSIGIVPIDLHGCGADFALGCTYKYLSGGPGSPAFVYAHQKHHEKMESPIFGWMGHQKPFAFEEHYHASGINKFMGGTPPILSMKALESALAIFNVQRVQDLYQDAYRHSGFLIDSLRDLNIQVFKPLERGGHVAFTHDYAYGFSNALIEAGFICDYRAPHLIRLCINPLYISMNGIEDCVRQIQDIEAHALYLKPEYNQMRKVT